MEAIEVDKVGAAQTADDWEPTSVRSQATEENKGEDHMRYKILNNM